MTPQHGPWPSAQPTKRVNWGMVAALAAIVALLLSTAGGVFGDYRSVDRRLTVLEAQRIEDVKRMERIETLLTKVWEKVK